MTQLVYVEFLMFCSKKTMIRIQWQSLEDSLLTNGEIIGLVTNFTSLSKVRQILFHRHAEYDFHHFLFS